MSREELLELFDSNMKNNKQEHDLAVKIGSFGVSPSYLSRYIEATEKIKSYEEI
ncbi:hypothetical protein [Paenibacillus sp. USHLN196]|uniref:hypothetical protein n=1 Tax=Paenibacillus sp. USHLN196 TaxID=3081291 RepID=UPI00301A3C75